MGIWVISQHQEKSNAKISGPIGSREGIQVAAPALFEFGGGHLYKCPPPNSNKADAAT